MVCTDRADIALCLLRETLYRFHQSRILVSPIISIVPAITDLEESSCDELQWTDILEFLYHHWEKDTAYVGFFLGYDFTQWIKTLPEERAYMLLSREGQAKRKHRRNHLPPHPVEYDGWQFDLLAHKRMRIRPKLCACKIVSCKCDKAPWMYICDTGGFFQTAFLNVIKPGQWPEHLISREMYETIKTGKENRSAAVLGPEMEFYNRCENRALEIILTELDINFRTLGINLAPAKWFGPGQAAQAWMKSRAPSREIIEEKVPAWFLDACRKSYYGGWFEIMAHGIIPGESHEYDINSAYPYVIASLPCLLHGIYERGRRKPKLDLEQKKIYLVRACVETKGDDRNYIGAMLHRDKRGRISRPLKTEGWYWLDELQEAVKAGCIGKIKYKEWMSYLPCKCKSPVREVWDLYNTRLSVGKDTPLGKACKLVYNSMYGKFAQSIGNPLFGNAIYASRITSGCRRMILNAISRHPNKNKATLMVATDAVYFNTPHPNLELSSELGQWEHKVKRNLTLFKPGVYWDDKAREEIKRGEHPNFKARGISAADFADSIIDVDIQFDQWFESDRVEHNWPSVSYTPKFSMTTALQALIQHDWSLAGAVIEDREMQQNSWPGDKRTDKAYLDREYGFFRSMPKNVEDHVSTEYKKRFGMDNAWSDESLQEFGITPDEYPASGVFRVLRGQE